MSTVNGISELSLKYPSVGNHGSSDVFSLINSAWANSFAINQVNSSNISDNNNNNCNGDHNNNNNVKNLSNNININNNNNNYTDCHHLNQHHYQSQGQLHQQHNHQLNQQSQHQGRPQQQPARRMTTSSEESDSTAATSSSVISLGETNYYLVEGSGMKDVHAWLKSLRLHKYSDLFSRMTYEQMMSLTEEQLESQGVTKGARHKIILNINKLKNRVNNLQALDQSLDEEGVNFIRQALNELKTILSTPIKPYHLHYPNPSSNSSKLSYQQSNGRYNGHHDGGLEEGGGQSRQRLDSPFYYHPYSSTSNCSCDVDNIENQFGPLYRCDCLNNNNNVPDDNDTDHDYCLSNYITKVMAKIGSIFICAQYADDECLKMFNVCTDKCLAHEAFTASQKQNLCFWKQQIDSTLRYSYPGRRSSSSRQLKGKWGNPKQPNEMNNNSMMNHNHSHNNNNHLSNSNNNNNNNSNSNNNNSHYLNCNITGNSLHCSSLASNAAGTVRRTRPMGPSNLTQPLSRFIFNYNGHPGFPGMERSMNSHKKQNSLDQHMKSVANFSSNDNLFQRNQGSPLFKSSHVNNSGQLMSNVLSGKESDSINTYIESLCLRMTEQALGGGIDEDMDF